MKNLTDRDFWAKYWSTKKVAKRVTSHYPFHDLFATVLTRKPRGTMLEIGGFPGYFAIFFQKYWGYQSTLLDYFVNHTVLKSIWQQNQVGASDITVLEQDFFTSPIRKQYDLVFSLGFLEHFDDTYGVIARHWRYVKPGGEMLIVIPNFLGLNGHIQLAWDPDNLNKHNLECMDLPRLRLYLKQLGIKHGRVFYWGGLRVWLEDWDRRSLWQKFVVSSLYIIGFLVKKLGINNRFLSPYLVIYAKK
jgi:SAM-dependent methyltransferase